MAAPSVEAIEAHVRRSPPDCLSSFNVLPVLALDRSNASIRKEWHSPKPFKSLLRLQCRCEGQRGSLVGYILRDYNRDYHGDDMITPIGFRCGSCFGTSEILDTKVHGYHAEVGKLDGGVGSAKYRGTGERSFWRCTHCSDKAFEFVVGFVCWDFDIILDEPTLPAQNFFNEFIMLCTCARCGKASEPMMLEKL